ncbi:hypothetical protein VitviT2T_019531 [Vitis vinifera]|uniref:Uncharacterized protein n=1 Tax=Vitis vinifera TaxID=29760 RepID=A0ABY9D1L5_VITVI|nr:hypothetical protein VitviT2T_019531 [Vitis vinifera]
MGSDVVFGSLYLDRIVSLMMIDLMSPDFFDLSYLWCHTGAYPISFGGSWILTDLRDHHLLDAHRDVDMIVTLRSL